MKNPVPAVPPAWIRTVHRRSSLASRCRWSSPSPAIEVISPSLARRGSDGRGGGAGASRARGGGAEASRARGGGAGASFVPLEVHRDVGRRGAAHQHRHERALFQLELKSELDAEMVRLDGFGRVGDMTAQCLDGVHGGAESLGERAADLVLRTVLAGLDIEPHAIENDL